jgi:hypothetical protein
MASVTVVAIRGQMRCARCRIVILQMGQQDEVTCPVLNRFWVGTSLSSYLWDLV